MNDLLYIVMRQTSGYPEAAIYLLFIGILKIITKYGHKKLLRLLSTC
jgi:hypothetical protein